jgi:hypothetical protein
MISSTCRVFIKRYNGNPPKRNFSHIGFDFGTALGWGHWEMRRILFCSWYSQSEYRECVACINFDKFLCLRPVLPPPKKVSYKCGVSSNTALTFAFPCVRPPKSSRALPRPDATLGTREGTCALCSSTCATKACAGRFCLWRCFWGSWKPSKTSRATRSLG